MAEELTAQEKAAAIAAAAARIGANPVDLARVISYESQGTFRTDIWGGKNDNYLGLIQFGPNERKSFGASAEQGFDDQLKSTTDFLQARGFRPGMGLAEMYSIVNAGSLKNGEPRWGASDGHGTVKQHVARMESGAYDGAPVRALSSLPAGQFDPMDLAGTLGGLGYSPEPWRGLPNLQAVNAMAGAQPQSRTPSPPTETKPWDGSTPLWFGGQQIDTGLGGRSSELPAQMPNPMMRGDDSLSPLPQPASGKFNAEVEKYRQELAQMGVAEPALSQIVDGYRGNLAATGYGGQATIPAPIALPAPPAMSEYRQKAEDNLRAAVSSARPEPVMPSGHINPSIDEQAAMKRDAASIYADMRVPDFNGGNIALDYAPTSPRAGSSSYAVGSAENPLDLRGYGSGSSGSSGGRQVATTSIRPSNPYTDDVITQIDKPQQYVVGGSAQAAPRTSMPSITVHPAPSPRENAMPAREFNSRFAGAPDVGAAYKALTGAAIPTVGQFMAGGFPIAPLAQPQIAAAPRVPAAPRLAPAAAPSRQAAIGTANARRSPPSTGIPRVSQQQARQMAERVLSSGGIGNALQNAMKSFGNNSIPNVASQVLGQTYGGDAFSAYTPSHYGTQMASGPNDPGGGSQYSYTTGDVNGNHATSWTTENGTWTAWTDSNGNNWSTLS